MSSTLPFRPVFDPDASPPGESVASRRDGWREWLVLAVVILHLAFLPWALGAMTLWSQWTSLGLSALGFGAALWAAPQSSQLKLASLFNPRRPATVVLWLVVAWCAYSLLQISNPSWTYVTNGQSWWLEPLPHRRWMPTGVTAPFSWFNAWRALMIQGSAILLGATVWFGLHRRKSLRVLLTALIVNGFALSVLAALEKLTGARQLYWRIPSSNTAFMASFYYPNHAAAYLYMLVAAAIGLATWSFERATRRGREAASAGTLAFLIGFLATAVVLSYSRMSIGLLAVLLGFSALAFVFRFSRSRSEVRPLGLILPVILSIAMVTVFGVALVSPKSANLTARFSALFSDPGSQLRARALARHATVEMWQDRWLYGWGAGSFRYGFPLYLQRYPQIYKDAEGQPMLWEHAHNDWLQYLAEYGVIGMALLLGFLGCAGYQLVRRRFWSRPVSLWSVFGCLCVLAHASVDFVFQNPAVLLTWITLLLVAIRWSQFEGAAEHPPAPMQG